MSIYKWPIKDVEETLDYAIDWSQRLATGEEITTLTVTVLAGGLVVDSQTHTDYESIVWLSGGTAGLTGKIVMEILTSENRIFREVVELPIINRAT